MHSDHHTRAAAAAEAAASGLVWGGQGDGWRLCGQEAGSTSAWPWQGAGAGGCSTEVREARHGQVLAAP